MWRIRRRTASWRGVAGLALAAAVVVGCAGSGADQSAPPADTDAPVTTSPLESRLGLASDPGRRQAQLVALQRQADTTLVQCMRNAGFYYVTAPVESSLRGGSFLSDGTRAWAARNGLGIMATFAEAVAADSQAAEPGAADTNAGYVASLTPEQASQYDMALVGDRGASTSSEFQPAGCWGSAFSEIFERLAYVEAFGADLEALNARLASDPRMIGFAQSWSACMEAAGYSYSDEAALADDVYARLLTLELVDDNGTTKFASAADADALVAFEREVGLVSFDCSDSYRAELQTLRFDYEQEFLDDNRFRIDDLEQSAE